MEINKWGLMAVILFALVFLFYTVLQLDLNQFLKVFNNLDYLWLSFSILSIIFYWFSEAKILQTITFSLAGNYSLVEAVKVTMIGQFFNIITPFASGGQLAQLYTLNKQDLNSGSAASILMIKFMIYQFLLLGSLKFLAKINLLKIIRSGKEK